MVVACLTGLANTPNPDVVFFLDGDYSDRPSELPIIWAPIIEGRADITLGFAVRRQKQPWRATVAPIIRQSLGRQPDQAFVRREGQ